MGVKTVPERSQYSTVSDPAAARTTEVAADAFCVRVHARLLGALTLYCGSRDLAEEFAQDVLVLVLAKWRIVGSRADPDAYVLGMAVNTANSWFRRRRAERRAQHRAESEATPDPLHAERMAVRAAVAALPARQRTAVVCRYFLDLSVQQTASVMGCAPGTVKAHTFKAVAALRKQGLIDDKVAGDG